MGAPLRVGFDVAALGGHGQTGDRTHGERASGAGRCGGSSAQRGWTYSPISVDILWASGYYSGNLPMGRSGSPSEVDTYPELSKAVSFSRLFITGIIKDKFRFWLVGDRGMAGVCIG